MTAEQVQCAKGGDFECRQSFPTPSNFYEHFHNGISNTWAMTAVTTDTSYIIICFPFKKQRRCFIYCRPLLSHRMKLCLEIPTFCLGSKAGVRCLTPCSSLQSSSGLCSPCFAGHCVALKCYTPATGTIAGASELSSGFLTPSSVSFFGEVKEQSFAPNQRALQLQAGSAFS